MSTVTSHALGFLALVPGILGADLVSGQNVFHTGISSEPLAVVSGLGLETLAIGVVALSRVGWMQLVASFLLVVVSLLLVGWGVVLVMFSGWGDGASSGASLGQVAVYFGGGILGLLTAILALFHWFRSRRKRRVSAGHGSIPPSIGAVG
ncbi:MAG: hypothetical protein EOP88_16470 [Verrucomicrobiaceae bacterium]|nr:MAG: hypothetical protein EOP88_16470 [Verrucomicrobiaceae bacterium]